MDIAPDSNSAMPATITSFELFKAAIPMMYLDAVFLSMFGYVTYRQSAQLV